MEFINTASEKLAAELIAREAISQVRVRGRWL
jgi:hypothetical protein